MHGIETLTGEGNFDILFVVEGVLYIYIYIYGIYFSMI